jgi:hypothetical protein
VRRHSLRLGRLALLLTAAAQPWCEAGAGARARDRLAARADAGFDDWDVDVHGLHVFGARATIRDQILGADEIIVGADDGGVVVDVLGLRSDVRPPDPTPDDGAPADPEPAAEPPPARGDRFRLANAGVPVVVRTAGTVRVPVAGGLELRIHDPVLEVDAAGWPTVRAAAALRGAAADDLVIPEVSATRSRDTWTLAGLATAPDGTAVQLHGSIAGDARTLTVADADGGTLALGHTAGAAGVRLDVQDFALARGGPWMAALLGPHGIELDAARISGALEITRGAATRVHAEDFVVDGVVVVDPRISAKPVRLGAVSVDGDATLDNGRAEFQLVVGHGEARIAVGGHAAADAVTVDLDLAPMPCDALLGAMPGGTADALVGMRLSGDIAASAHLAVSRAELERARAGIEDASVGELTLEFPFLERCRTIADPANVDLVALRGPYRHRFADDDGRVRERVLAPGAPQFVPLGRVPKIASAFIALEDMRYWYHDGFDREQIERAFWHNVVSGRVRRGASTISQQTARNLWLGVDRSFARKLQEAYLTTRLETAVSKTRILELYVNLVELGPGIYGVDAAAQFYFGKPASELDVLQAVHLASMAPAPRTYADKWKHGEVDRPWLDELRGHVRRMHRNRMIRDADLRTALRGELGLVDRSG